MIGYFTLISSCTYQGPLSSVSLLDNGCYSINYDHLSFIIDPSLGARVLSAKIDDREILLQERDSLLNWGSTFWPAPQSLWNWPPPRAIHFGAYNARIEDNTLVLKSETDPKLGISAEKRFSVHEKKNFLEIIYKVFNNTDSTTQIGPWEVTCIPARSAKVLFPMDETHVQANNTLEFENRDGIGWFEYNPANLKPSQKMFNDASDGWLACIGQEGTIFIKSFENVAPETIAPGQATVEVYVSKRFGYIELENHGRFQQLKPGESLEYKVRWFLSVLQEEISPHGYSTQLIDHIKTIIR